jgi:hypothetical protein
MYSIRYFCRILMKFEFSRQIFENISNITFHKNLSTGGRVVPRGQTDKRTDMTKLIVAIFRKLLIMLYTHLCVSSGIQILAAWRPFRWRSESILTKTFIHYFSRIYRKIKVMVLQVSFSASASQFEVYIKFCQFFRYAALRQYFSTSI